LRRLKIILLATMMMGFALLSTANFAHASILGHNWVGALIKDQSDDFLGYVSAGYETGSSARLIVNVNNHLSNQMNISAVKVWFDWGINYTSTEANITNIYAMPTGTSHLFTVTFTVPDTTTASNLVKHNYKIYVEDVNATTGSKKQLNSNFPLDGSDFAVLSDAQATAIETDREIDKYYGYSMFITAKARELSFIAEGTRYLAYNAYQRGDFSGAAANYQEALALYQYAWSNETESISGFEQALNDLIISAQSQLTMVGWGYITFGIGWIFIGIGVIIYAVRKPKAPAAPQ
jgi:hypothetical protein